MEMGSHINHQMGGGYIISIMKKKIRRYRIKFCVHHVSKNTISNFFLGELIDRKYINTTDGWCMPGYHHIDFVGIHRTD